MHLHATVGTAKVDISSLWTVAATILDDQCKYSDINTTPGVYSCFYQSVLWQLLQPISSNKNRISLILVS